MAFASPDELADRLGRVLTGMEIDQAQAALDDATALILSEAGDVDWDPDGSGSAPAVIVTITLAVAMRAFQNPAGVIQSQVGDVSVSYSRDGGAASLFLTRDEKIAIRRAAGRNSFTSVPLAAPWDILDASASLYFVDVIDQNGNFGDPIPLGPWPWELP